MNRRTFVSLVAGAATAFSAESVMAALSEKKIKAIALDGLAVFDLRPVAALTEYIFPGREGNKHALAQTTV